MNTVNKLLKALNENIEIQPDKWALEHHVSAGMRKWIADIVPAELLKRSIKQAIESLITLSQDGIFYKNFPNKIDTPNYGDNWGVIANYIEINNRAIAEMNNNTCRNGLLSTIKMLPAIPPSEKVGQIALSYLKFSQIFTVMDTISRQKMKILYME